MLNKISQYLESFYIPQIGVFDWIEIIIIIFTLYQLVKGLRNTRAWMIIKGIIFLCCIYLLSTILGLNVICTLFQATISLCVIALIIVFQAEIKKFLEELGTKNISDLFKKWKTGPLTTEKYSDETIHHLVEACSAMSDAKTGALIIVQQDSLLNDYVSTGISLNSDISSQLILNIFEHNTPLHDGAIIIHKNQIVAATCYLPLSESKRINKKFGTRHRAGIGLSEVTDAIVIIVSEETGNISFVKNGKILPGISVEKLEFLLHQYQDKKVEQDRMELIKAKKKRFTQNLLQKFLCSIGGILLWVGIVNSQNPLTTKTFIVPVVTENEEALTEIGKTYEVVAGDTATVTVTAAKSIIDNLNASKILARADLEKLSYTYAVPIEFSIPSLGETEYSISSKNNTLQVKLDEVIELETNLEIETVGECNEDYYLSDISSNTVSIKIKGAKSIVNTIDVAKVLVDISGKKKDFSSTQPINIYDKNGSLMNHSHFKLSANDAIINGTILPTKEVPLDIKIKNATTKNYKCISYTSDVKTIRVAGTKEDLEKLDKIPVSIRLDKDNITESTIKTIQLDEYVDSKYIVVSNKKINIDMKFEIYGSKSYDINTGSVEIKNLKNNLTCSFKDMKIKLSIKGLQKEIESFDIFTLKLSLDVNNYAVGNYNVPIKIENLPDSMLITSDGIVSIEIKEK